MNTQAEWLEYFTSLSLEGWTPLFNACYGNNNPIFAVANHEQKKAIRIILDVVYEEDDIPVDYWWEQYPEGCGDLSGMSEFVVAMINDPDAINVGKRLICEWASGKIEFDQGELL